MVLLKTSEQILQTLNVTFDKGLTAQEAAVRLKHYGLNELKGQPTKSLVARFIKQFQNLLIYVLLIAAAITCFIAEYSDALIIFSVVMINAIIGVLQEYKADKAMAALQKLTSPLTLVRRDGILQEIRSKDLVPGDIVLLDSGRYIPADLQILTSANLQIDESALTGESVPVRKNAAVVFADPQTPLSALTNMTFMSTFVTYGRGEGIVVRTGRQTEIGKIADLLDKDIKKMTPLQKRLDELGCSLGLLAIGICTIIFLISATQNRPLVEMFLMSISLAVAAIPESLAAIVAIILAVGITRMSKSNAIVKHLPSVETLGAVNIIGTDKTGTLTQNKMTVRKLYTIDKITDIPLTEEILQATPSESLLIEALVLCSDASFENNTGTGDPTEIALLRLGNKFNLKQHVLNMAHARVAENAFDSNRKLMSTLNQYASGYRVYVKGALDTLLKISTAVLLNGQLVALTEELKQKYLAAAENMMSADALRILAAGYKDTADKIPTASMESDLILLGFAGIIDPPRLEVRASIAAAKAAGIIPVMITGDHQHTALAIAKELDIAESLTQSITGTEIDRLTDEAFTAKIHNYRVFARVSPAHKVKIIRAFKAQGNVVAMTGDGVNDAPSLKFADVGVAMGITGSDVAKGACDIILTDDNFTTIVRAIEEGRTIYNNIKKSIIFLLSCNLGEVLAIFLAILFFWPLPLLPTQILWINLITDSFPAIALGLDAPANDMMKAAPRNPKDSFFAQGAGCRIISAGSLIGLLTLGAFYLGLADFGYTPGTESIPPEALTHARTMAFVVLAFSQLFYALSLRHEKKSILQTGFFSNMYLLAAIVIGLLAQYVIISVPALAVAFKVHSLSPAAWAVAIGLSLLPLFSYEFAKLFQQNQKNR